MSDAIVVAIIGGVFTLAGVVITVWASFRKAAREQRESNANMIAELKSRNDASDAKLDKEIAVIKTEITTLSEEVRKHNAFAERIPALEEKAKAADRRLTDLEHR